MLAAIRRQGCNQSEIARLLGRHRSTSCRELSRNSTCADDRYRAFTAQERTNGWRSSSRRNRRFSAGDFARVEELLRRQWSPRQVAGYLARSGQLSISHVENDSLLCSALINFLKKRFAAKTSRLALSMNSIVCPDLSTAR